jgi:asparagine synthase (glutamine-hydrolysing)
MCGLAALFQPERQFSNDLLDGIDADLYHRGPDSGGRVVEPGFSMVFRRLAIMDPRPVSDQPISDPRGHYSLVFNGEIYNFKNLRRDLEGAGVTFHTAGDTEVLLHALITWGEGALERLEGMYAFVFVDRRRQMAVAARDPLGIKPLYIARQGSLVALASEMRPLTRLVRAEPDPRALAELLEFRFAAGRLSNLQGIERLPGGHVIRISLRDGSVSERKFCDSLKELRDADIQTTTDAAELAISDALDQSIAAHLQSDVGFCVQLSGGIDSSLVSALSSEFIGKPIRSFGIDLSPAPNDEGPWRRAVVKQYNLDHHEVRLTGRDYADALPDAVRHMEGPTAHSGCVLLMLLCREIAKHNKVVLTGEGADEMFGGYKRYGQWKELQRKGLLASLVPNIAWPALDRWREYRRFSGRDPAIYSTVQGDYLATNQIFPDLVPVAGERQQIARDFGDIRSRMFAVDQTCYLESLLLRQDKLAMASSLEARVPFAHLPFARILNRLPHVIRAPGGETKPLLKKIASRHLPHDLIYRRKVGLTIPSSDWLADDKALGRYFPMLTDADSRLANYANRAKLREAVDSFRRGVRLRLPPLDHLLGIELWLRSLESLRCRKMAST